MRALILAAGRGERMGVLTTRRPKPLIEVGGKTLLARLIEQLADAGFHDLVVNSGYLGQQIVDYLGDGRSFGVRVRHSPEPATALETGGAMRKALPLLGTEPFAVVNADVLTDFPFEHLRDHSPACAHLVLVPNPPHHPHGDFALVDGRARTGTEPRLTFAGISVVSPAFIQPMAPGRFPIVPALREAMSEGRVTAERHDGFWADIGTPERLALAEQALPQA